MKLVVASTAMLIALWMQPGLAETTWLPLPQHAPEPSGNPMTPAKIELGRLLFNDYRLSESASVSCASCHDVPGGGADKRAHSLGVHGQPNGRNAPTVLNVGFLASLFWDGRAGSLEEQARIQLLNPIDMGNADVASIVGRIRSIPAYRPHFDRAFGAGEPITIDGITSAIAAYERTLVTAGAPYDLYVAGDSGALSARQQRGMAEFKTIGCSRCHQGPAFDGPVLTPGTPFLMKFPTFMRSPYVSAYDLARDQGLFEATGKEADRYHWRVPSLRNLLYTAPYMHNGSVTSLADAVRVMGSTELDRTLTDAEVGDLVAFLEALSGPLPVEPKVVLPGVSTGGPPTGN